MRGSLLDRLWIGLIPLAMACSSSTEIRVSGGGTLDAQPDSIMVPVADAGVADASPSPRNPSEMGEYAVENRSLLVPVEDGAATIGVELFLSEGADDLPLVIFTVGPLVNIDAYRGLATYLASHGFAVGFPVYECTVWGCPVVASAATSAAVAAALVDGASLEAIGRRISSVGYVGHFAGASIAITAASLSREGKPVLALLPYDISVTEAVDFDAEYPDLRERIPHVASAGLLSWRGNEADCFTAELASRRLGISVRELPRHVHWEWRLEGTAWVDVLSEPAACVICEERCLSPSPQYDEVQRSVKTLMAAFFAQALLGEDMEPWLNPEDPNLLNSFGWISEGG